VGFDSERCGKLIEPIDAEAIFSPFESADVCSVDTRGVGQRFLRQALARPQRFEIAGKILSARHRARWTPLSSDDPRSILVNVVHQSYGKVVPVERRAPEDDAVADYDRRHLALYAALMDADDSGQAWQDAATSLMRLDASECDAEACWRSHLERARWIVGDGLEIAIDAFNQRRPEIKAE
jgi:hypothetical protein